MKKKNKIIGISVYAGIIAILCVIFHAWWMVIAVLGIMALLGFLRTRRLENGAENPQKKS